MIPHFDEKGQRVMILDQSEINDDDIRVALNEIDRIAAVIATTNERYKGVIKDNGAAARRYINSILGNVFTIHEIANNQTTKNIGKHWKILTKDFPSGGRVTRWVSEHVLEDNSLYRGDGSLSPYRDISRDIVQNFVMDVFSQFVGILKINQDTAVVSINPVDILMTSIHNTGFVSCHNIMNGDWRTASLSFLCDKVTAIGFVYRHIENVESEDEKYNLHFEWSRRIWRQMIYFFPESKAAFQGAEYGRYQGRTSIYQLGIRRMITEILAEHCGCPPTSLAVPWNRYGYFHGPREDERERVFSISAPSWISCDYPIAAIRLVPGGEYPKGIYVASDTIPCAVCGATRIDEEHHSISCEKCGYGSVMCEGCGEYYNLDDVYAHGGCYYCNGCKDDELSRCDICDDYCHSDNVSNVEVLLRGERKPHWYDVCDDCREDLWCCDDCSEVYAEDKSDFQNGICPDCIANNYFECELCKELVHNDSAEEPEFCDGTTMVVCYDCTNNLESCDDCGCYVHDLSELSEGHFCKSCVEDHEMELEEV